MSLVEKIALDSQKRKQCLNLTCIFAVIGVLLLVMITILIILERAEVIFIEVRLSRSKLDACPKYTRLQENDVCWPDSCTPEQRIKEDGKCTTYPECGTGEVRLFNGECLPKNPIVRDDKDKFLAIL